MSGPIAESSSEDGSSETQKYDQAYWDEYFKLHKKDTAAPDSVEELVLLEEKPLRYGFTCQLWGKPKKQAS